ncbi:SpoIIE family protein phosphatase [Phaeacidiphilus oryzae]|uniref:SpoIIE family protein phosphatase n=1 Tax=Phaeacidiphilus oryzae TaxID=348818 RepID=UPI00068DDAF3|nr:SpoIIE family protein phosphatase [Phaeacidiphilus oryzae]
MNSPDTAIAARSAAPPPQRTGVHGADRDDRDHRDDLGVLRLGPTYPTRSDAERARRAVRELLDREGLTDAELGEIAGLLAHEAVLHSASGAELRCRLRPGALELEMVDGMLRAPLDSRLHYLAFAAPAGTDWGVDFGGGRRRAWFRLPVGGPEGPEGPAGAEGSGGMEGPAGVEGVEGRRAPGGLMGLRGEPPELPEEAQGETEMSGGPLPRPRPALGARTAKPTAIAKPAAIAKSAETSDTAERGRLALLAEAGQLLAGLLDGRQIATITAQLVVPRLADWAAVHLADPETGALFPVFVWHTDERRSQALRTLLETPGQAAGLAGLCGLGGVAREFPLIHNGRGLGLLQVGRADRFPPEHIELLEELARRVVPALHAAETHRVQVEANHALQRGLLPQVLPVIPNLGTAVVYEPAERGSQVGGDFYDLFPLPGGGRWAFALGDVCGHGPRAAAITGLARHSLRLLARYQGGGQPSEVLERVNRTLIEDTQGESDPETGPGADTGADTGAGAYRGGGDRERPGGGQAHGAIPEARMLALLKGELTPHQDGSVGCALACAGQPLPLLLGRDGGVRPVAEPQLMLGISPDARYTTERFRIMPGETLLCVTDGVTERRRGRALLDDGGGLAELLSGCAGLGPEAVADRLRRVVLGFGPGAPNDDIAMLVLQVREPAG